MCKNQVIEGDFHILLFYDYLMGPVIEDLSGPWGDFAYDFKVVDE